MRHREVETSDPCIVHSGPTGTPSSERYHPLILYSCAQEPLVDVLGGRIGIHLHGPAHHPGLAHRDPGLCVSKPRLPARRR